MILFIIGVVFGIVLTLALGKWWFEKNVTFIPEEPKDDERTGKDP